MWFKKKEIKELTETGRMVAITLGTIFGVGVGMAGGVTAYNVVNGITPPKKVSNEEDDQSPSSTPQPT